MLTNASAAPANLSPSINDRQPRTTNHESRITNQEFYFLIRLNTTAPANERTPKTIP